MRRVTICPKTGMKKGAWTAAEDRLLSSYITRYGHWNWGELPKYAGLSSRCGKSCRLRWMNYLRPHIKRGNFTDEEDEVIINTHEKIGNRWSVIAASLQGRTDNEIKNHWHTHLKKRTSKLSEPSDELQKRDSGLDSFHPVTQNLLILESSTVLPISLQLLDQKSTEFSSQRDDSEALIIGNQVTDEIDTCSFSELDEDFWAGPLFVEDWYL